jgi:hypothetical protein
MHSRPVTSTAVIVSTLIGHRDANMALTCLGSLVGSSQQDLEFRIHDDGTLTSDDRQELRKRLPVLAFIDREIADQKICKILKEYPACWQYRKNHVLGLKLFDVALLSSEPEVAFCDSDVLFFHNVEALFTWPDAKTGSLFMQDHQESYALRPWQLLGNIVLPRRLNSGLFFFRREHYDLNFIEWILKHDYQAFRQFPFWVEQTCWAALAWRSAARLWSAKQLKVIKDADYLTHNPVAGHFTSTVRSLLPGAINLVQPNRERVLILTEPTQRLRFHHFLIEQTGRRVKRIFA